MNVPAHSRARKSVARVGIAGWSYDDWKGRVYPAHPPRGFQPLVYLTQFVQCMELNSSFYAYPTARNCAAWVRQLEERDFPFLVKLHQDFTHSALDEGLEERAAVFLEALEPLRVAGRLKALLLQFPFSFARTPSNRQRLARIVELVGTEPLVLELRHRSWFEPQVLQRFRERNLSVAHIDLPQASDHPPATFEPTGPIGYLRLHGRNTAHWFRASSTRNQRYDYLYSPSELDDLAQRAEKLSVESDETYVVTNNHFEGQAVANAIELRRRLSSEELVAPEVLLQAFPRLREQAGSDEPPSLFS